MEYSGLFSRGWGIIWRNKWMWLLAFIPAASGLITFGFNAVLQRATAGGTYGAGLILQLSCLQFIVAFLVGLIGLVTRGGLIAAVDGVDRGESYSFGRAFGDGRRKIWPLLGMSLLLIGGFSILVVLGIALIITGLFLAGFTSEMLGSGGAFSLTDALVTLGFCCLAVFFALAAIVLNLVYPFAYRGIMLRDMGARESIRHGWKVMRGNLGEIVLLALPFFLLSALLTGLYTTFALRGSLTAILSGDTTAVMNALTWQFIAIYVIWASIYAVLLAWQSATFTLGYRIWTGKGALGDEESLGAAWTP